MTLFYLDFGDVTWDMIDSASAILFSRDVKFEHGLQLWYGFFFLLCCGMHKPELCCSIALLLILTWGPYHVADQAVITNKTVVVAVLKQNSS